MRTKIPFAGRCLWLCAVMMSISVVIAGQLIALQITGDSGNNHGNSEKEIFTEMIPAQRGIIMDRNREPLAANLCVGEVKIERHALRDINQVTYGLAYNLVCRTEEWLQTDDQQKRERLLAKKRCELLENARKEFTPEERAEIHRLSIKDGKAAKMLLEWDTAKCEAYYLEHDKLVSELLARFTTPGNGCTQKYIPLSAAEIQDKIGQYQKEKQIAQAKARGEKPGVSIAHEFYLIKDIQPEKAEELKRALDEARIKGVSVAVGQKRNYLYPKSLAHIVGNVSQVNESGVIDVKGAGGIEAQYNVHLSGSAGHREYRKNVRREIIPHLDDRYCAPQNGLSLQLTIDMGIQAICEEELDKALRELKTDVGCVIVQEAVSGDILAMVNRPSFDLNTLEVITPRGSFEHDTYKDRDGKVDNGERNYACQTLYNPGSTFKPIAGIAAIDGNPRVTRNATVECGSFMVMGKKISDGSRHFSGRMSIADTMKMSCNPATANIVFAYCGKERYLEYLKRLGIFSPVPVTLPSMFPGASYKNAQKASRLDLATMSYGYSLGSSPMHVAQIYSSLATGGVKVKPRLVDALYTDSGKVYDTCEAKAGDNVRIMERRTAKEMLLALETVLNPKREGFGRGTGHLAAIPGYRIAGKTGTATKLDPKTKQYIKNFHDASFAGIFPIDENINWEAEMAKPKEQRKKVYVIFTVVDGVAGGGGSAAAPIFRTIAERLIEHENIPPNDPAAYAEHLTKKAAQAQALTQNKR